MASFLCTNYTLYNAKGVGVGKSFVISVTEVGGTLGMCYITLQKCVLYAYVICNFDILDILIFYPYVITL